MYDSVKHDLKKHTLSALLGSSLCLDSRLSTAGTKQTQLVSMAARMTSRSGRTTNTSRHSPMVLRVSAMNICEKRTSMDYELLFDYYESYF